MATLDAETLDALNALLEDTRASVEIELALANGETELREQDTLVTMGGEEVLSCCALREQLTLASAPVTRRISGIVFHILGTERYDERLRAFARHQAAICARAETLLTTVAESEAHQLLQDLYDSHVRSARWAERRATEFAATRLLDFSIPASARMAAARARAETAESAPEPSADGSDPAAHSQIPSTLDAGPADASADIDEASVDTPHMPTDGATDITQEHSVAQEPPQHNGHAPAPGSAAHDNAMRDDAIQDDERTPHPDGAPRQE